MAYTKYSLTPSSNTAAPPDGAPEGMLPSAVNDTMRDMMAQIRDCGDGIRGGTYTMTAPIITGGTINGATIGATTASTGKFTAVTNSALTSGRVTYAGTAGVLQDDADFTFNGTTVTMANDASISGLTVGKGGGAVATSTAVGYQAINATATGTNNTVVGYQAAYTNTSGDNIVAVGYQAAYTNATGTALTAIGNRAGRTYNTNGTEVAGSTFVGSNAGRFTTTGIDNAFLGALAGYANTTGASNVAVGSQALQANTTASENTAVGYQALYSNTTGIRSVAMGYQAGYSNTTSNGGVFLGMKAGYASTGALNICLGYGSGEVLTSGTKNTILGSYSGNQGGLDIRTASNYIVLSDGDGNPRGIFDNSGHFLVGKTGSSISTAGIRLVSIGVGEFVSSNDVQIVTNRLASDGDLVSFRQDGTQEGTISVSGTTVSYNGGHLSRWSQLPNGSKDESIVKGTVMSNLDDMCVWEKDGVVAENEQLNKMKVSDVEGDTNVAGVFVNWTIDADYGVDDMNIAMTGDMIIRIADGVVVQKGDLLMSAGDGTAKPQGDDIVRSKTIAKVTSNYVTCTYADGSYCVPCVLMAC